MSNLTSWHCCKPAVIFDPPPPVVGTQEVRFLLTSGVVIIVIGAWTVPLFWEETIPTVVWFCKYASIYILTNCDLISIPLLFCNIICSKFIIKVDSETKSFDSFLAKSHRLPMLVRMEINVAHCQGDNRNLAANSSNHSHAIDYSWKILADKSCNWLTFCNQRSYLKIFGQLHMEILGVCLVMPRWGSSIKLQLVWYVFAFVEDPVCEEVNIEATKVIKKYFFYYFCICVHTLFN